jgi:hypothetical protein
MFGATEETICPNKQNQYSLNCGQIHEDSK